MKPKFKVLAMVERDGKTYWIKSGVAFVNKDDSINVHLDVLPREGKLQLREWDADDLRTTNLAHAGAADASAGSGAMFNRRPAAPTDQPPF